ncbi:IS481 family transposase [Pontibacter mangrovi]|uniref:IS481 family transposase n=2 Tax=Pseudomonadati TaxID=3379134 RepID=A0A501W8I5_9RHOB|nr:IS481 family transposase [Pontibacter mangrovi]TPE39210.1 IS481 family transposase [Pontibacter mangrovi]TPE43127.1 IS481 family transposase [Amaricoccus solimangrovi]
MKKEEQKQKAREDWIRVYQQLGSVSKAALRCGIARSTLHRWIKRLPDEGLADRSRRPHRLARQKWDDDVINLILDIRDTCRFGKIRICSHLLQQHQVKISPSTVARVLEKYDMKLLKRYHKKKVFKRYAKEIPGERVQMDVCKIDTGIYQYTAIDDCSRFRVLHIYSRRTAKNTVSFLERVVEQMPFPIQRVQTDRGKEFFGIAFQEILQEYGIKFRPIKPRSPHLNGKVERSHQTDLQEFYMMANLKDPCLNDRLEEWQFHYNWHRSHSSLKGKTPMDVVTEKSALTPLWEDIEAKYDSAREPIREQNYGWERKLSKYKKKERPAKN